MPIDNQRKHWTKWLCFGMLCSSNDDKKYIVQTFYHVMDLDDQTEKRKEKYQRTENRNSTNK